MATQLSSLLLNEISVHYIHIYSYCYDRKSPRSHFVCGHFALTKQRNNCWLHFYFIFVFSNSKNVSYIFYYWFPHTRTHQNTHTFNLTYHSGKKVEKGVATAAVKLILTTAQTVILAFLVQMTSVSNQFYYIRRVQCIFSRGGSICRRKWSWKSSDLAQCVCVFVYDVWKCFCERLNNQKTT